ncbi:MAG: hypothetical protein NTV77_03490 [Candidatus Azambacteria bacterium]|nr:hypothetical protein [Candidatus Azambacteria bacterium]
MKIIAWIFIILGTLSLFTALASTFNLGVSFPGDFGDWWMNKKIRNKFFINSIIDFIIAGYLLSYTKKSKS